MTVSNYSENILLVELPGEPNIRSVLDEVIAIFEQYPHYDVVVDLKKVDIMVSLSLSGFIMLHKLVKQNDRRMVFCNTSNITRGIFNATCFDAMFEFIDTKTEAFNALQHQPQK